MSLDLKELISITFTREEWAVVIFGLANLQHGPKIDAIGERLCAKIQHDAAPIGVMVRVLVANKP